MTRDEALKVVEDFLLYLEASRAAPKHAERLHEALAVLESEPSCACGGEAKIRDLKRQAGNWKVLAALGRDVPYLLAMADVEERLREEMGKTCACGEPRAEGSGVVHMHGESGYVAPHIKLYAVDGFRDGQLVTAYVFALPPEETEVRGA